MSKKVNHKGRNVGEARHVRLYDWMLVTPAWQSLDVYGRQLYVEFKLRYTGSNNGDIGFSGAEMEAALRCSNRPVDRALLDLVDRGFVKLSQKGSFDWKSRPNGGRRSNTWILTEYPIDYPVRSAMPATKDFMKWSPPSGEQKKTRGDESTAMGCADHPISRGMGCGEHRNEVTRAPHEAGFQHANGVRRAPPYNIPDTGPLLSPPKAAPIHEDDQPTNAYAKAARGE